MRGPTPLPPAQYSGPLRAVPVVSYFQSCSPVAASSANTPFCALKYITPSTTSRPLSKKPDESPVLNVQARLRFLALSTLICDSVENFVPPGSWPKLTQSFCPGGGPPEASASAVASVNVASLITSLPCRQSDGVRRRDNSTAVPRPATCNGSAYGNQAKDPGGYVRYAVARWLEARD